MTIFKNVKQDFAASIVVFLVALPLCLGIALASGAPFFSGIIAGIIGGIVIGSLSGSSLSVSGPAAGLSALVYNAITNIGDFRLFLCAVLLAGLIQIGFGLLKLGKISSYFPTSVIKGLLASIGIIIIAKQLPFAIGFHEKTNDYGHWGIAIITIVCLAIMLLWEKPTIKARVKFLPGALVAVLFSISINEIFKFTGCSLAIHSHDLVNIKAASSTSEFFTYFTFPNFGGFTNVKVIVTGIMIAIIASLETLLSIEAVDNIDPDQNVTNTNRELIAQGVGNSVSGLIGGLPITSVIVRSSANINAGGKTKLSAIMHGIFLLFAVALIPSLLNHIPLASLAAILILTGYKLTKVSIFKQKWHAGKARFIPFIATVAIILAIDLFGIYTPLKGEGLLIGVIGGLIIDIGIGRYKTLKI